MSKDRKGESYRRQSAWLSERQISRVHELSSRTMVPACEIIRKGVDLAIDYFDELNEVIDLGIEASEKRARERQGVRRGV